MSERAETARHDPGRREIPPGGREPASRPARRPSRARGRTWELELLISGVVTFALLQLPAVVDGWFERADALLAGAAAEALTFGYAYLKLILYTLIAAFLLHLAARAYWVGLIGLDSVFPKGVRWDRIEYGPITKAFYRENQPSLRDWIRRTDRFCSVIFSFAFLVVLMFVVSILLAAAIGGISLGISRLFLGGERVGTVYNVLFWIILLPGALLPMLDRRFGERLDPAGRPARLLRSLTRAYYVLFLGAAFSPILNVLLSHFRYRTTNVFFFAVLVLLFSFFFVKDGLIDRGRLRVDGYVYLPAAAGEHGVDPRHYESRRAEVPPGDPVPSIQSDMVTQPFVRLFLPYLPGRHNPLVAERCPGVRPLQEPGLRLLPRRPAPPPAAERERALDCLAGLQAVSLNGEVRRDLRFHFYTQPETGLRGIVAYLPTADLPPGENLLTVEPLPPPPEDRPEDGPPPPPHHLPFWVAR